MVTRTACAAILKNKYYTSVQNFKNIFPKSPATSSPYHTTILFCIIYEPGYPDNLAKNLKWCGEVGARARHRAIVFLVVGVRVHGVRLKNRPVAGQVYFCHV